MRAGCLVGKVLAGGLIGLLTSSAGAAPLRVTASQGEVLYSSTTGDPSCSRLSSKLDAALPLNVTRLAVQPPAGVAPDQVRYQWSVPKPALGVLAADVDLGPEEQSPAIRTLCAEIGNGCVLTEEQLAVYNHPTILWIAPGCDILPDNTASAFPGGRVRIRVRASSGRRRLGRGAVTVGFGHRGSLELRVRDLSQQRFRNGIGKPSGELIFLNPVFGAAFEQGGLPDLDHIDIDTLGGGEFTLRPPCGEGQGLTVCTQVNDVRYTSGGKHVALATAVLKDGSALCDKLAVNVRTANNVAKLEVSIAPRRPTYVPGGPSGNVGLRVRVKNVSPPDTGSAILLSGNVLTCETEVRVGNSTLMKTTQIDLEHCSATVDQSCDTDADCSQNRCPECQPNEVCLTSSHCSTLFATPLGCTNDADCRPPRCPVCSPSDICIQVIPLRDVVIPIGDATDLVESRVPVANILPARAAVKDTWTVHPFNAPEDSDVVKYGIAPRPDVKP